MSPHLPEIPLHHWRVLRFRLVLIAVCLALGLVALPGSVRADVAGQFELAESRYKSGRYEEAVEMLQALLATPIASDAPDADERRRIYRKARPYLAAALVGLGRMDEADEVVLHQLLDDPFYKLPRGKYPDAVGDRFIDVAARHREAIKRRQQEILKQRQEETADQAQLRELREERLRKLELLAAEEKIIAKRSRLVAAVPFGVGQFQNEATGLGIFFAASEALAIGSTIVSAIIAEEVKNVDPSLCDKPDPDNPGKIYDCSGLSERFEVAKTVNYVSFGTSLALIVAGIIEAQVSLEEVVVTKRKRKIPPPIELKGGATHEGFFFGLQGRF
jgi:tetratricopeptide (TPR) repeat protein